MSILTNSYSALVPVLLGFQVSSLFPSRGIAAPRTGSLRLLDVETIYHHDSVSGLFRRNPVAIFMHTGQCWLSGQSGDVLFLSLPSSLLLPDEFGGEGEGQGNVAGLLVGDEGRVSGAEEIGGGVENENARHCTIKLTFSWALHSFGH
ncbi:hypothetical protein HOY82DRAFT_279161 [Tuber indicum]|nr:hypothetical protein HOY82DRAFT_279161 [Tuber indicum]